MNVERHAHSTCEFVQRLHGRIADGVFHRRDKSPLNSRFFRQFGGSETSFFSRFSKSFRQIILKFHTLILREHERIS